MEFEDLKRGESTEEYILYTEGIMLIWDLLFWIDNSVQH